MLCSALRCSALLHLLLPLGLFRATSSLALAHRIALDVASQLILLVHGNADGMPITCIIDVANLSFMVLVVILSTYKKWSMSRR